VTTTAILIRMIIYSNSNYSNITSLLW
jgi:hypothetical protein